jgi:hypothetical protein
MSQENIEPFWGSVDANQRPDVDAMVEEFAPAVA